MVKVARHPEPEKLLRQITGQAVNMLGLVGADRFEDAALLETGMELIVKAWELPQEILQASNGLVQKEKERVQSMSEGSALPDSEMIEPYDGPMIAELIWGLFETAVRLESAEDRASMHQLALWTAEALDFDEWIERCGPQMDDQMAVQG